jgi:hypothetical protein
VSDVDLTAVIEKAIESYNAQDWDSYQEFFVPDLQFVHHNRGFEMTDRDTFIQTLKGFASDLIPDRRLHPATRLFQSGDLVVREQQWGGTAIADVPGIAAKGETFTYDFCTVYRFGADHKVVEYHEYG